MTRKQALRMVATARWRKARVARGRIFGNTFNLGSSNPSVIVGKLDAIIDKDGRQTAWLRGGPNR